ncbi:MAG: hypothetical protein KGZ25_04285, partial [Planctomycetes bacterium]|nr:hypothetical protein [Planctomycetota bacterium]
MSEKYDEQTLSYLEDLYGADRRNHAFGGDSPSDFKNWCHNARPALRELIGLNRIRKDAGRFTPSFELQDSEKLSDYTRQKWIMETEPGFEVPFWFLEPAKDGPHPLAVFPHGHYSKNGLDCALGIADTPEMAEKIEKQDRDVAIQALRRGFAAIAPATRGFHPADIPDVTGRHGNRDCRSHLMHSLLAGRTVIGERVWDLERLIDWASERTEIDTSEVLMMGNSGGGVATLYAAACDERVTTGVVSCSFCRFVGENGKLHHCDCNIVPGIMRFGAIHDVAGLICPRRLLIVNGREDSLFPPSEVDRAVSGVEKIFQAAGAEQNFRHRYGSEG